MRETRDSIVRARIMPGRKNSSGGVHQATGVFSSAMQAGACPVPR